jgi:signal transduction histidine kinase
LRPGGRQDPDERRPTERGEDSISSIADLSDSVARAAAAARLRSIGLDPDGPPAVAPRWLDELEREFDRFAGNPEVAAVLAAASARARALQTASGEGPDAERSAALAFAADALTGLTLEGACPPAMVAEMASRVARVLGASPDAMLLELFIRAASSPALLELPPLLTIELQLQLLLILAPITEVSLWVDEPGRQLQCLSHAGGPALSRRVREIVRAVFEGDTPDETDRSWLHGVPVLRWQQPHGVLVGRAHPNDRDRTRAFLHEAGRYMAAVLEREMLLERSSERERTLADANERRLMRLGFDLHDGALQDLAVLGHDVENAQREIAQRVPARARRLVSGRLEDISAQVDALESSLRELSRSLEPKSMLERPLMDVLRSEVEKFEARGTTRVTLELGGDMDDLTASQRIIIYRIVQEGLSNVRDHSNATEVRVTVDGRQGQIEAQITDNGDGFHVEPTLIRAAKNGRLGLVGIGERVRMLGGRFDVRSRVGGPTTLSVSLARWRPQA